METVANYLDILQAKFRKQDLLEKVEEKSDSDDEWHKKKEEEDKVEVHMASIRTKNVEKKINFIK